MSSLKPISEGQTRMFRCGCVGGPGCGKILTEGQVESNMRCSKCGSRYVSIYYPQTKWQLLKCYFKLMIRGEAWV